MMDNQLCTLYGNVRKWAEARNLIEGSDAKRQYLKLVEEFGELARGIAKNDEVLIKDSIGDVAVVGIIMLAQLGYSDNVFDTYSFAGGTREKTDFELITQASYELANVGYALSQPDWSVDKRVATIRGFLDSLIDVCNAKRTSVLECLSLAYNEIKDRTGRMVDGVFIKDE